MFRPTVSLSIALLSTLSSSVSAADPFADPVKDCRPCRFSPGGGQPEFELTFVFKGSGRHKQLTAFDVTPAGGGQSQRLDIHQQDPVNAPLDVADFPDGFILGNADMGLDELGDLSVVTLDSLHNRNLAYWLYQPDTRSFAPLERVNDDGNRTDLRAGPDKRLSSRIDVNAVEFIEYFYELTGNRAVAVSRNAWEVDGTHIVDAWYDLTVKPARVTTRTVIGFSSRDSATSARRKFARDLDAAAAQAEKSYRGGDAAGAADAIAAIVRDMRLSLVTSAYPVDGDPGDLKLVQHFNDYGFYLERAGKTQQAVDVLSQVTDVAQDRTVAYLNLADAQYAAGRTDDAKTAYAEYRKRMIAVGRPADVPPRVAERLR